MLLGSAIPTKGIELWQHLFVTQPPLACLKILNEIWKTQINFYNSEHRNEFLFFFVLTHGPLKMIVASKKLNTWKTRRLKSTCFWAFSGGNRITSLLFLDSYTSWEQIIEKNAFVLSTMIEIFSRFCWCSQKSLAKIQFFLVFSKVVSKRSTFFGLLKSRSKTC